jgi:hypothetical protein
LCQRETGAGDGDKESCDLVGSVRAAEQGEGRNNRVHLFKDLTDLCLEDDDHQDERCSPDAAEHPGSEKQACGLRQEIENPQYRKPSPDPGGTSATETDGGLIDEERHQGDIKDVTPAKSPGEVPVR